MDWDWQNIISGLSGALNIYKFAEERLVPNSKNKQIAELKRLEVERKKEELKRQINSLSEKALFPCIFTLLSAAYCTYFPMSHEFKAVNIILSAPTILYINKASSKRKILQSLSSQDEIET